MSIIHNILIGLCLIALVPRGAGAAGAPDAPFRQELHEPHPLAGNDANDVRSVGVNGRGVAWAATRAGAFRLDPGTTEWKSVTLGGEGPAFKVLVDGGGALWIGAWDGLYRALPGVGEITKIGGITAAVSMIMALEDGGVFAIGPVGAWRVAKDGKVASEPQEIAHGARAVVAKGADLWVASNLELTRWTTEGAGSTRLRETLHIKTDPASHAMGALAFDKEGRLWTGGMGGISVFRDGVREKIFTPGLGLPNSDVRALAFGPEGRLWVGTALGVARYDGTAWALRHGRRWVRNDDVRDISIAPDGAAWIATKAGVSVIREAPMTLEAKAARFLEVCYARHIRAPGLVEKCRLEMWGDLTTWKPRDDDNDGQYTAMYLAMESYRYAATGDPAARERARAAFHALRFLQTVTGTDGFVARSVVSPDWPKMADPNEEISDADWASMRVEEPRAKRVGEHWRPSADGRWLWKGDTSSDEITGHLYGYLMFHDLAADENDKREVAAQVAKVMDHIIDSGYYMRDLDGQPTRWGVWAPEKLNRDPLWAGDRGINSVEILSFLKASHHITGNPRYKKEYLRLARDEGYADNTRLAKVLNPSVRTHIDDELLAIAWPGLFLPGDDPELLKIYREGFEGWREANKMEQSPFFNFTYAAFGGGSDPTLDDSLFFLRDAPLDLIHWTMDNSRREDVELTRLPEYEHIQTNRLLPPSERDVVRWDNNPWVALQGDRGRTESDGVYWLLPYWMGRYYGYIKPAKAGN